MRTLLLSILLSLGLPLTAADWYVKADAGGAQNGTSWTDAWTNTTSIVWSSLSAGDTVWLSGGTSGLRYNGFTFAKSGSALTNRVTVKKSQDAGHTGLVTIDTSRVHVGNQTNITLDGANDDDYVIPTSVTDLRQITNNIGIRISVDNDHGVFALRFVGVTLRWLEICYSGIEGEGTGTTNKLSSDPGIQLSGSSSPAEYKDSVIEYCWIHHNTIDGINNNGAYIANADWDLLRIHHCVIEDNVDDGMQWGTMGLTVDHCIIANKWTAYSSGHPDSVQHTFSADAYCKTYNNILYNTWNAWLYSTLDGIEGGTMGKFHFFGNLCYMERDWVGVEKMNYGAHLAAWGSGTNVNHTTWVNTFYGHNTLYYCKGEGAAIYNSFEKAGQALFSWTPTNVWMANNLLIDVSYNPAYANASLRLGTDTNTIVNTNAVRVAHNLLGGANTRLRLAENLCTNEAQMLAVTGYSNFVGVAGVVSTNTYDFRLTAADTLARNRGYNVSSWTNALPELMTDLYGNPRFADGQVDIGAHEYTSSDLVLHFTFENGFDTNGQILDISGAGNHGLRFGRCSAPTNWPTAVTVTKGDQTSTAASFRMYADGYGIYLESGDYAGVTNLNEGMVTQMTLLVWAQYVAANRLGITPTNYLAINNAAIVDSGIYRKTNGWTLGHENFWAGSISNRFTQLQIWHGTDPTNRTKYIFPDYCDAEGNTDAMHQYGFVFSNGLVTLYFDGVPISTNSDPNPVLALNTATHWLGIAGGPHHGSDVSGPYLTDASCPGEDEYPNWRWFPGYIDDLRIYTAALSAAQIAAIYTSESSGGNPPTEPSSPVILRATTVRAGNLRTQ